MDVAFDDVVKLVEQRHAAMQTQVRNRKSESTERTQCSCRATFSLPRAPPVVEIRRLTRRFGDKTALDDVSLTVPRGGVFGLIGGNGAGKTTLIKHILGLLKAQSGTVQVFGLDPVANPGRRRSAASATCPKTATCPTGCASAN